MSTSSAKTSSSDMDIVKEKEKGKNIRTVIIVLVILAVISSPLWLCGGCATITALLPSTPASSD